MNCVETIGTSLRRQEFASAGSRCRYHGSTVCRDLPCGLGRVFCIRLGRLDRLLSLPEMLVRQERAEFRRALSFGLSFGEAVQLT